MGREIKPLSAQDCIDFIVLMIIVILITFYVYIVNCTRHVIFKFFKIFESVYEKILHSR